VASIVKNSTQSRITRVIFIFSPVLGLEGLVVSWSVLGDNKIG